MFEPSFFYPEIQTRDDQTDEEKQTSIAQTIKQSARLFWQSGLYKKERDETHVSLRGPDVVQPVVDSEERFYVDDSCCLNETGRQFRIESGLLQVIPALARA